jgi:hypothetical protein
VGENDTGCKGENLGVTGNDTEGGWEKKQSGNDLIQEEMEMIQEK